MPFFKIKKLYNSAYWNVESAHNLKFRKNTTLRRQNVLPSSVTNVRTYSSLLDKAYSVNLNSWKRSCVRLRISYDRQSPKVDNIWCNIWIIIMTFYNRLRSWEIKCSFRQFICKNKCGFNLNTIPRYIDTVTDITRQSHYPSSWQGPLWHIKWLFP